MPALFLLSICATGVLTDFLGPTYPAPKDLASNASLVSAAWDNVTSTIETYVNDSNTNLTSLSTLSGLKNLTFSMGMFSIHDTSAAESLQFHHTSAEIGNSSIGLHTVDGNSIYRIASITKLVTAYAGMLELNSSDWDRPIIDFVPTLAEFAGNASASGENSPAYTVQWDQVTLATLADQIAGVPRDVTPYNPGDYLLDFSVDPVATYGFPPLNLNDTIAVPPCALSTDGSCPGNEYAKGAMARPPMFLPWASPAYTDNGFMLLGLAIENITGKSIHDVYRESIFCPLGMDSSYSFVPQESEYGKYVIPGNASIAALLPELAPNITVPSGGILSTTNDLAKWGTAILNSTLLPPDQTRKWMKPVSHTARLEYSVGKVWEIYRYTHPSSGIVTDIYTKSGDSGAYGGFIVIIPDFDAGFSIIGASSLRQRSVVTQLLTDLINETMLPALMAQAEVEAEKNFVGTYTSTVESLNTTLTLSLNQSEGAKPGLIISSFISNGTDILLTQTIGPNPVRLLPSIPDAGTGQIAFRASPFVPESSHGLFYRQFHDNIDWLSGDSPTYGGFGVGLFVLDLDSNGKAVAATPTAWRIRLEKESSRLQTK